MIKSKKGKIVVLSGLSATGKTTMAKLLSNEFDFKYIDEHKEWINKGNIIKYPANIDLNKKKQLFFLDIFYRRHEYVKRLINNGINVICDSDFTSSLAYNYAFHFYNKELDVYKFISSKYIEYLSDKRIEFGDAYIYLDCKIEVRQLRRTSDKLRIRNDIFFNNNFAQYEREFFIKIFTPNEELKMTNSIWYNYNSFHKNDVNKFGVYLNNLLNNNFCNNTKKLISTIETIL